MARRVAVVRRTALWTVVTALSDAPDRIVTVCVFSVVLLPEPEQVVSR
jgi:hypothetical protein